MLPAERPAPGGVTLGAGRIDWDAHGTVRITGPAGEAVASDGVAAALAALAVTGATAGPLVGRPTMDAHPAPSDVEEPFAADVDMTSWALIVGGTQIVKVPRRIGTGDRGARLQRLVAERAPGLVPPVIGTVEHAESGAAVALVTQRVPGATDGWTWAVDALCAHLEGGADPVFPEQLGAMTARLHAALAAPGDAALATPGVTAPAAERGTRERAAAQAALSTVLAPGAGADERPGATARLLARADAMRALIATLPDPTAPPFTLHGDLHVGQVLRGNDGQLLVIDFDGDPQHPDDDAVGDAAIDVAHLQVSLDLVGAIVAKRRGDDPRIADWCLDAQQRLLDGYLAEPSAHQGRNLLDPTRLPGLRGAQLVRELGYARDFLPRWAYAADWAITHRFPADPTLEDPPWTPPAFTTT